METTTHPDPSRRRTLRTAAAGALAAVMVLAGCTGGDSEEEPEGPRVSATILEPADNTVDVVTSTGIEFVTEHASETTVELADLTGNTVDGELSPDGSRWRPDGQLEWDTTYVATVTATSADGEPAIATSQFTTMSEPPDTIRVRSFLGSENVVGIAMPLRIVFWDDGENFQHIPEEHRAEVERRLHVRTEPEQTGTWHWVSGAELHYRPEEFWEPGTQIHYRLRTGGLPVGDGRYLRNDLNVNLSVGRAIEMSVDNATGQMTVRVDGEVVRTIPVSLGRSEFPSTSGIFPIMEKYLETEFDTFDELGPEDGYRVDVEYAMRYTRSGEFIHATVRDGSELGADNVTHGCVNMSRDNAEWLYDITHNWGDPLIIEGTRRQFERGNGWTDWNVSWDQYRRGSALFDG